MAHTLYVVGIGPGNPEYVVPRGLHLIKQAKVLVGSERALEDFCSARSGNLSYCEISTFGRVDGTATTIQ